MSSPDAILRTRGVSKSFGDFRALTDVSLSVAPGSLHALIGPNGAGKTTFFNVLTGQLAPTSGTVEFNGEQIHTLSVHERAHRGIARSFQITTVFPELSVRENVRLAAQAVYRGLRRNVFRAANRPHEHLATTDEVLDLAGLADVGGARAGTLSHGRSRRLEIAIALASRPRVLLLDEPLSGMGVDDVAGMEQLLRSLVPRYTVLLVEHNMPVTMAIADRISILVGGQLLTEGTPAEVSADVRVRDAYLGRGHL